MPSNWICWLDGLYISKKGRKAMLETILQLLITGVALGFVYALVGVEYTLVWQSSGLLNVAHNMLITTAAFVFGGTSAGPSG